MFNCTRAEQNVWLQDKANEGLRVLHKLKVLHCDTERDNMLMEGGRVILVDFLSEQRCASGRH